MLILIHKTVFKIYFIHTIYSSLNYKIYIFLLNIYHFKITSFEKLDY